MRREDFSASIFCSRADTFCSIPLFSFQFSVTQKNGAPCQHSQRKNYYTVKSWLVRNFLNFFENWPKSQNLQNLRILKTLYPSYFCSDPKIRNPENPVPVVFWANTQKLADPEKLYLSCFQKLVKNWSKIAKNQQIYFKNSFYFPLRSAK